MNHPVQYVTPSTGTAGLLFQEYQDDERVLRKAGSEHQRLADGPRESRGTLGAGLRSLAWRLREALLDEASQ